MLQMFELQVLGRMSVLHPLPLGRPYLCGQVDMVFEVRDARIPFTSANEDLDKIVGPSKARLIVLNKVMFDGCWPFRCHHCRMIGWPFLSQ